MYDGEELTYVVCTMHGAEVKDFFAIAEVYAAIFHRSRVSATGGIYSDSRTAISWVRKKSCKTLLERTEETEQLFQLIERAEAWLKAHRVTIPIVKWETEQWGEIPADFGRK